MWKFKSKESVKKEYDADLVVANQVQDIILQCNTLDEITAAGKILRVLGKNRYVGQLSNCFNAWEFDIRIRIIEDKLGLKAPERFVIDTKEKNGGPNVCK